MLRDIKLIVIIALIGALAVATWYYKGIISNLNTQLHVERNKVLEKELEVSRYKAALLVQTKEIQKLSSDYKKAMQQYKREKNKKPKIRYKVIYKEVVQNNDISKNDDNTTQVIIDNIRRIDYSDL